MEEQVLVEVKQGFLGKFTKMFKKLFTKNGEEKLLLAERNILDIDVVEDTDFVIQQEILDARSAFRKYVIVNTHDIEIDIFDCIVENIRKNKMKIKKIIEINKDNITYEKILYLIGKERNSERKFKNKNKSTCRFSMPIGVIGVECAGIEESIQNMLYAISTRNSIIILKEKVNQYSTEDLILLIIKESLKSMLIDDNIIQILEKDKVDISKLNKFIGKEKRIEKINNSNVIYLYQEDSEFNFGIQQEIKRLQSSELYKSYSIKPIRGEFGDVINYINSTGSLAVCMYTNNQQKAYKFMNWIDSSNIFVNTGIRSCGINDNESEYFHNRLVLHEGVF